MKLSIVIPVLNEATHIVGTLAHLKELRALGCEVIVVDGGSTDNTVKLVEPLVDKLIKSLPGRATQMNSGAQQAEGDVLLFLHADTVLPNNACDEIVNAIHRGFVWGRFDVRLSGRLRMLRVVENMMNFRSRWTGVATGDQAVFVKRSVFDMCGGFPCIPLMEDVALSKILRRVGKPYNSSLRALTSSRRWEENGVWRTIVLMWCLRLAYFFGVKPEKLALLYR